MHEQATRTLAMYNKYRLEPGSVLEPHPLEIGYVESIREKLKHFIPTQASYEWYESLLYNGPGQTDQLFPYLADKASKEQMAWFLSQEAGSEAGFDDLVAMTQVKMPVQAKLEMARNYWDEEGRGREDGMHGKLLKDVVDYFGVEETPQEKICSEPLLLSNLMIALACHRRYAWLALGALGVIEMTAPGRVIQVDKGLARLKVPKNIRSYFTLHGVLDMKHSREWNREVIKPLVAHYQEIAEGAYLRLWAGERCFVRYRLELGLK